MGQGKEKVDGRLTGSGYTPLSGELKWLLFVDQ